MTLPALAAVGGVMLFTAAGWPWTCVSPLLRAETTPVRAAHAYLLGLVTASGGAWAASRLLHLPLRRTVVLLVAIGMGLLGAVLARWRAQAPAPVLPLPAATGPWRHFLHLAVLLATISTAGLFADAVTEVVSDYDGYMTWVPAARWIKEELTVEPTTLVEARWFVSHPRYPVLLPLSQVIVHEVFNSRGDDRAIRMLYAAFYPAFLLILWGHARRLAGARAAALAVMAVSLVPTLGHWDGYTGANTAYGDLPLGTFWGAALLLLLRSPVSMPDAGVAALLLAAGLLTKNEGLPLACVGIVVALGSAALRSRPFRRLATVGAAAIPLVGAAWLRWSWQQRIPNRWDEDYSIPPIPAFLNACATRLPDLPRSIAHELLGREAWAGFWLLAALILLAGWRALLRRPGRQLLLAVVLSSLPYLAAYVVTPWPGTTLVPATCNRFALQLSLPLFVLMAMAIRTQLPPEARIPAAPTPD